MRQDAVDQGDAAKRAERGLLDARDDLELTAAAPAGLDLDSGKRSDAERRRA
jgi:hypothetical protein